MNTTLSPSATSVWSSPVSSQSTSFTSTKMPGRLHTPLRLSLAKHWSTLGHKGVWSVHRKPQQVAGHNKAFLYMHSISQTN